MKRLIAIAVTPCVGVWIEITSQRTPLYPTRWSLPAWECGLKLKRNVKKYHALIVPPCVGVWIEMGNVNLEDAKKIVTPCVGVWIEIFVFT